MVGSMERYFTRARTWPSFIFWHWRFDLLKIVGGEQTFRPVLKPKLAIGIRHLRTEYLRRKFPGRRRKGRHLRHLRKNRRRARRGFPYRRRRNVLLRRHLRQLQRLRRGYPACG